MFFPTCDMYGSKSFLSQLYVMKLAKECIEQSTWFNSEKVIRPPVSIYGLGLRLKREGGQNSVGTTKSQRKIEMPHGFPSSSYMPVRVLHMPTVVV